MRWTGLGMVVLVALVAGCGAHPTPTNMAASKTASKVLSVAELKAALAPVSGAPAGWVGNIGEAPKAVPPTGTDVCNKHPTALPYQYASEAYTPRGAMGFPVLIESIQGFVSVSAASQAFAHEQAELRCRSFKQGVSTIFLAAESFPNYGAETTAVSTHFSFEGGPRVVQDDAFVLVGTTVLNVGMKNLGGPIDRATLVGFAQKAVKAAYFAQD
jgi:hypothetical protein